MTSNDWDSAPAISSDGLDEPGPSPFGHERYSTGVELGRGGMGQVLSVRDENLDRKVALKKVLGDSPERASRLAREARITARLEHPGIVPVYSAGQDEDGTPFYTMRLIRGRSLHDAISEARSDEDRTRLVRHVLDACHAMAYAHSCGVLHRDLKPSNIMVGEFGETQVVDWGLARTLDEPDRGVPGTPAFMSPEQAQGHTSVLSDVYSLGAVLQVTLGTLDIPELGAIAGRALAKDPADRYPDARALARDLERWFAGRRVQAHDYTAGELLVRFVRAWAVPLGVAAIAGIALVTGGVLAFNENARERDRAVAAEEELTVALTQADAFLEQALIAQARQAQARGAQAEAEVLALAALEIEESAEARGVLASFGAGRPSLSSSFELPDCLTLGVDGATGRILCGGESKYTVYEPDGSVLWELEAEMSGAVLAWGGEALVGRAGAEALVVHRPIGTVAFDTLVMGGPITPTTDSRYVLVQSHGGFQIVDIIEGTAETVNPCGGTALEGSGFDIRSGRFASVCSQGEVFVGDRGTPAVHLATAGGLQAGEFLTDAVPYADGAVVSTSMARLLWIEADGQTELAELPMGHVSGLLLEGDRLAAHSSTDGVVLFDMATRSPLWSLSGRDARAAKLGPDGALVAAGVRAGRWDVPESTRPWIFTTDAGLSTASISPDGRLLAMAAGDGDVDVFHLETGRHVTTAAWQDRVIKQARFTQDGTKYLGIGMGEPGVFAYNTASWEGERIHMNGVLRRLTVRSDGTWLALNYAGGLVADGEIVDARVGLADLAPSHDASDVVGLLADGAVVRIEQDLSIRRLFQDTDARTVAIGQGVVALGRGPRAGLYTEDGALLQELATDGVFVLHLAFSPDGAWVAGGMLDGSVRVWDVASGALLGVLTGHAARVSTVEFGPSRDVLVSASWDRSARLWDLSRLVAPLEQLQSETRNAWGLSLEDVLGEQ